MIRYDLRVDSWVRIGGDDMQHKLKATEVKGYVKAGVPGYHGDGAGLWLQISKTGGASWSFRYMLNGRAREMGLGPERTIKLDEAREKAREARKLLLEGIDPIERLGIKQARKAARLVVANTITFAEVADKFFAAHSEGWSHKHRGRWKSSMRDYVLPVIGDMAVDKVGVSDITKILEPLFRGKDAKPVTATGVRGRLEAVLGYATTMQWRSGDNPARWRGHLQTVFSASHEVKHHEALPIPELPTFMQKLQGRDKPVCREIELLILTACREKEVRLMNWSEVNLDAATWTVPAERMKARKEHVVPLSKQAVALLQSIPHNCGDRVFSISNSAVWNELRRILGKDNKVTAHGFRSCFRDWAGDDIRDFDREAIEFSLAHKLKDKAEASYRRTKALTKRRLLMQAWADYCFGVEQQSNVTPIRGKAHA
jgi:integrase